MFCVLNDHLLTFFFSSFFSCLFRIAALKYVSVILLQGSNSTESLSGGVLGYLFIVIDCSQVVGSFLSMFAVLYVLETDVRSADKNMSQAKMDHERKYGASEKRGSMIEHQSSFKKSTKVTPALPKQTTSVRTNKAVDEASTKAQSAKISNNLDMLGSLSNKGKNDEHAALKRQQSRRSTRTTTIDTSLFN